MRNLIKEARKTDGREEKRGKVKKKGGIEGKKRKENGGIKGVK